MSRLFQPAILASWLLASSVGLLAWPALPLSAQEEIPAAASVNGKYTDLQQILVVPGDEATFGKFNDWGHWTGQTWANYQGLPPSYWVYVAPKWYLWKSERGQAPAPELPKEASANGKYAKLLRVLDLPGDEAAYGKVKDWGYWTGTSYQGFNDLPVGYWVYVAPKWYIWEKEQPAQAVPAPQVNPAPQPNGAAQLDEANLPKEASANGKYAKLIAVLNVPGDEGAYSKFRDYGQSSFTNYGGRADLPAGAYWVYVAPNWYLWREVRLANQVAPNEAPQKATVDGKYADLVRVIYAPADANTYGAFKDYGASSFTSYAGQENLPAGAYWVYVAPNWYLWSRLATDAPKTDAPRNLK